MRRMTDNDPKRKRTITWEDPRPLAEAGRSLSGLEFLQKIVAGEPPHRRVDELRDRGAT